MRQAVSVQLQRRIDCATSEGVLRSCSFVGSLLCRFRGVILSISNQGTPSGHLINLLTPAEHGLFSSGRQSTRALLSIFERTFHLGGKIL